MGSFPAEKTVCIFVRGVPPPQFSVAIRIIGMTNGGEVEAEQLRSPQHLVTYISRIFIYGVIVIVFEGYLSSLRSDTTADFTRRTEMLVKL